MIATKPNRGGIHKSAVLLVSLGADVAAQVLPHLESGEVEQLVEEINRLGRVTAEERVPILDEFDTLLHDGSELVVGGPAYSRLLLDHAGLGDREGAEGETSTGPSSGEEPDPGVLLQETLTSVAPEALAGLVAEEHPQLIALLISQLSVEPAAAMLAALPTELQGPVTARLAEIEAPSPMALEHLNRFLAEKLKEEPPQATTARRSGPKAVADILGRMRRSVEELVLGALENHSPTLFQRVNRYRFTFDHLLQLDSRTLQRVLRDVEADTLRQAMKGLDTEGQQVIFSNMSERAAARLREDLETGGNVQLREVELAQQSMVRVARVLQESGEVQFTIGEGEEEEAAP